MTAGQELVISRIFDAPRELVYRAFTDPDQLAKWFGPVGWTVPRDSVELEPRPGGRERFVLVCDDDPGQRVAMDYTFSEVIENELLVDYADEDGVRVSSRLEFHEAEGGKTRIELRAGPFPEGTDDVRGGWESSFTKLDALLAAA